MKELKELNPPPYVSRVKETEVAKSLSFDDTAPHNDLSIYCDSDKGNSTIQSNQSQTKTKEALNVAKTKQTTQFRTFETRAQN